MNSFAERLKAERERLGLSQVEMGEVGGVKKLAQLNYEKGERQPDALYLAAIAAKGVDVAYLLTGVRGMDSPEDMLGLWMTLELEPNRDGPATAALKEMYAKIAKVREARKKDLADINKLLCELDDEDFDLVKGLIVRTYQAALK